MMLLVKILDFLIDPSPYMITFMQYFIIKDCWGTIFVDQLVQVHSVKVPVQCLDLAHPGDQYIKAGLVKKTLNNVLTVDR